MVDSFDATVGRARAETARMSPERSVVTLDTPRPVSSGEVRAIVAEPVVGAAEPGLRLPGRVGAAGRFVDVSLDLLSPRARLWRPSIEEGRLRPGGRGILLSRRSAEDLRVGVGDPVTLRHAVLTGAAALGATTARVPVAGIHGNPFARWRSSTRAGRAACSPRNGQARSGSQRDEP